VDETVKQERDQPYPKTGK